MCMLFLALGVSGQGAALTFDSETHDFGKIRERNGTVSHSFTFTNGSDTPVVITHVMTSCGCTTPEYPKRPILSGERGVLSVTFDPWKQPSGDFDKTIYVQTNQGSFSLIIKGYIVASRSCRKRI